MIKGVRYIALGICIFATMGCTLFGNRYSPPDWLIGTWETARTGGDYPNYDHWEITEDNLIVFHYRVGALSETFDYSDFGYRQDVTDFSYILTAPLMEDTYEICSRIVADPDHVEYFSDSSFLLFPEEYTLHRTE